MIEPRPESQSQTQQPTFPPMHPVTRLGRVIQQMRSYDDLHASELEALAAELDTLGATDAAARIRVFRDVQRGEGDLVVDELVDIQQAVSQAAQQSTPQTPPDPEQPIARPEDAWRNSPKRC